MFLTHSKIPWFLLITCCLLLAACGNTPLSQSTNIPQTNTTSTSSAGSTPLSQSVNTPQTNIASVSTSTAATPLLTSSCPMHPAAMPALPTGAHPNVIYLSERGGLQTIMTAAQLIRYDTITKSKSVLLSFTNSGEGISDAQLSTNGQWILFLANSLSTNQSKVQLIRADGQMLQTLFCVPTYKISNIRWSPDSQHVAFAVSAPNGQISTIQVLDLTTVQQKAFTVSNYRPHAWLDNMRLYIIQPQGSLLTSLQKLSLLDTSQSNTQLTSIASANAPCNAFEKSTGGTQLFTSSCTPVNANGCQGPAIQGPSTLSDLPATGGLAKTIYHSQNQAIMTLHPISPQTLLMYIENTSGDLSQNGLWKINTDGSGLTRLTTTVGRQCDDLGYPALYPQIVSSGQYYALRTFDSASQNESLLVGSINGNAPTVFELKNIQAGVLILVGMVMS